jgi:hypothetical protein
MCQNAPATHTAVNPSLIVPMTGQELYHCAVGKELQPKDGKYEDKNESDELHRTKPRSLNNPSQQNVQGFPH